MKLVKNDVVDFICAMNRFANRKKQYLKNNQGIPDLVQWCKECENRISPFLLNDISLLVEKMAFPSKYLFFLGMEVPESLTVEDFLNRLSSISPDTFNEQIKSDFLFGIHDNLSVQILEDSLMNESLNPGYDAAEEAALLHNFLQRPELFLNRLHSTYSDFYRYAYEPALCGLKDLAEEKFQWHQMMLEQNADGYYEQLGLSSFISSLNDECEPKLYYSLFLDSFISTFWNIHTAIIGAGTDLRIKEVSARGKTNEFFSCFSDPKRLEILRLTAKRPWYSSELAKHFGITAATLSYHIGILVDADLLHLKKGKSRRFYFTSNKESIKEYLDAVVQDLL